MTETCPCGAIYTGDGFSAINFRGAHKACRAAWVEAQRTFSESVPCWRCQRTDVVTEHGLCSACTAAHIGRSEGPGV